MTSNPDPSQNYSYLAIVAIFGFVGFMMQPTAYTWGEQDMMPFFERVINNDYLTNDFFTNSTTTKNPRWIYGYLIVGISWATNVTWYNLLYILKLLFLTFTPILYFKVIVILLRKYIGENAISRVSPFVLVTLVLMIFLNEYRYYFSVASFLSYFPAFHAYNISVAFCFIGIILKEAGRLPIFYLPFFILCCLIHPTMGLFSIGFYAIFLLPDFKKELRRLLPVLVVAIVSVILIKLLFAPEEALPTSEFIDIYVKERHPRHYSVPDFINLRGSWMTFFIMMNTLFAIPFTYGFIKKKKKVWLLSILTWVAYSGAVVVQYIFIEVIPSKFFAYLGITRFTTFGYWMLVILWALVLSDFIKKNRLFVFPSLGPKNFAFIIINLIFVGILFIDSPKEDVYNKQKAYYNFVNSTPKDAIFMAYSPSLNTDMRLIGRRGVFISNEFPFAEQYISEYGKRRKLLYGSRDSGMKGRDFYRNLNPKDFIEISKKYRLDYILIESNYSDEFENYKSVWENKKHRLYSIKSLRE